MKNSEQWQPSKYVYKHGRLIGSRDPRHLNVGSRLMGDLVARFYDQSVPKYANGKLLDLGCGNVPLYKVYKDYVSEITCVDWPNSPHKIQHLDLEWDLNTALPFEDAQFDTIILSDVLEHIPEPAQLWGEISRILTPGGYLLMNVPYMYWLHERPNDYYRYTEFALRRFVENAGLNLIQIQALGGSAEVFADFVAKHLQFIPVVGKPISLLVQYMAMTFGKTSLGMRLAEKSSEAYPLGYTLIAQK